MCPDSDQVLITPLTRWITHSYHSEGLCSIARPVDLVASCVMCVSVVSVKALEGQARSHRETLRLYYVQLDGRNSKLRVSLRSWQVKDLIRDEGNSSDVLVLLSHFFLFTTTVDFLLNKCQGSPDRLLPAISKPHPGYR